MLVRILKQIVSWIVFVPLFCFAATICVILHYAGCQRYYDKWDEIVSPLVDRHDAWLSRTKKGKTDGR